MDSPFDDLQEVEPLAIIAVLVGGPYDGRLLELGDWGMSLAPARLTVQYDGNDEAEYRYEFVLDDEHHLYLIDPADPS
jgi:hypothetical protein